MQIQDNQFSLDLLSDRGMFRGFHLCVCLAQRHKRYHVRIRFFQQLQADKLVC